MVTLGEYKLILKEGEGDIKTFRGFCYTEGLPKILKNVFPLINDFPKDPNNILAYKLNKYTLSNKFKIEDTKFFEYDRTEYTNPMDGLQCQMNNCILFRAINESEYILGGDLPCFYSFDLL